MVTKKIIRVLIAGLIPLILVTSCGNDSTAPDDGTIEFTPITEAKWETGLGGCSNIYPGTGPELIVFRITVKSADGVPLGKVDLDLSMILSGNSSTAAVSWLLIDLDKDGLFDGFDGTIGSYRNSADVITLGGNSAPYSTQTNEFGWLEVAVVNDVGGCEYAGWLAVTSGAVGSTWVFDVTVV